MGSVHDAFLGQRMDTGRDRGREEGSKAGRKSMKEEVEAENVRARRMEVG